MLSLIILRPSDSRKNINVYLRPLVDDTKEEICLMVQRNIDWNLKNCLQVNYYNN
jgi:hypothetical protein